MPTNAHAYVNWGRWVADCPVPDCTGAEALTPGQGTFHCQNCLTVTGLTWPGDADNIWQALQERPVPATRNWFPADHHLALRAGAPAGQTASDLRAETADHLEGGP